MLTLDYQWPHVIVVDIRHGLFFFSFYNSTNMHNVSHFWRKLFPDNWTGMTTTAEWTHAAAITLPVTTWTGYADDETDDDSSRIINRISFGCLFTGHRATRSEPELYYCQEEWEWRTVAIVSSIKLIASLNPSVHSASSWAHAPVSPCWFACAKYCRAHCNVRVSSPRFQSPTGQWNCTMAEDGGGSEGFGWTNIAFASAWIQSE